MSGFNVAIFDTLTVKTNTMDERDKCVALVFDEMSLKSALAYNHGLDKIEGFEELETWVLLTLCLIKHWFLW